MAGETTGSSVWTKLCTLGHVYFHNTRTRYIFYWKTLICFCFRFFPPLALQNVRCLHATLLSPWLCAHTVSIFPFSHRSILFLIRVYSVIKTCPEVNKIPRNFFPKTSCEIPESTSSRSPETAHAASGVQKIAQNREHFRRDAEKQPAKYNTVAPKFNVNITPCN